MSKESEMNMLRASQGDKVRIHSRPTSTAYRRNYDQINWRHTQHDQPKQVTTHSPEGDQAHKDA
jgi:hypothetical protein